MLAVITNDTMHGISNRGVAETGLEYVFQFYNIPGLHKTTTSIITTTTVSDAPPPTLLPIIQTALLLADLAFSCKMR